MALVFCICKEEQTKADLEGRLYAIFCGLFGHAVSLNLNNSEPPQNQEQPLTQLGLLQTKLEEAEKENQNLRSMLNQITEHYAALKIQLLLVMQQQQLCPSPRNNNELQKDKREDDMEKAVLVLPTWPVLSSGDPSPSDGSTTKGCGYAENIGRRNLTYAYNNVEVEGKINNQVISQEAKIIEDGASEASCRKARVSIRARSDFYLASFTSNMGSSADEYAAFEEKVRRTVYFHNMSPQVTESVRAGPAVMEMFDDRPLKPNNRKIECCWLNPSDPDFKVAKELKKLAKNKLLK